MSLEITHLTREDLGTPTWERLTLDLRMRLDALRIENDSASDHDTTTKRRGRIAELKGLLDLAEQAQRSADSPKGLTAFLPEEGDTHDHQHDH